MVFIARKNNLRKLVQPLDSGDFVVVHVYFRAWHIRHPCLFVPNTAFDGVIGLLASVKIFSGPEMFEAKKPLRPKNRAIPYRSCSRRHSQGLMAPGEQPPI